MENGELTQWVNFSNQLQTRTRRGDQWSPTNRYDVALHGRPLAAPTVRQYAVRITQRKMPNSTFIFHSQFSIFNSSPSKKQKRTRFLGFFCFALTRRIP